MKTAYLLLLILFFGKGCDSDIKKTSDTISFEYEAMTRGSYKKIIVKKDTLFTIYSSSLEEVKKSEVSKNDWNTLLNLLEKVDLNSIEKLKAPTNKRAYDGALHANLKVIYKYKTYQSNSFDANNPPKEIEEIVHKIVTISNKR